MKTIFIFFSCMMLGIKAYNSLWKWNGTSIPRPRRYSGREYASACANGGYADVFGFACPHMMMLSDDMILASKWDKNNLHFDYAVAGGSADSECGMCYQVQLLDAEREWRSNFKQLVIQVINSGFDVMPQQFDIFMGAGGFGYYTACNQDCQYRYCQGGACRQSMYQSDFDSWDQAQYNDPNACYSGGIKWLDNKNATQLLKLCTNAAGGLGRKEKMTIDSCYRTNMQLYHQNFVSLNALRVQCPQGLTRLTGLKRSDDAAYPKVSVTNQLTSPCRGDRTQGHYCITTMQDCCKPSCAWSGKGRPDPQWPRVDTCQQNGSIWEY